MSAKAYRVIVNDDLLAPAAPDVPGRYLATFGGGTSGTWFLSTFPFKILSAFFCVWRRKAGISGSFSRPKVAA